KISFPYIKGRGPGGPGAGKTCYYRTTGGRKKQAAAAGEKN
ncbi:hypothetical protein SUBVAR_07421, partial [Subdoligranulum variabile DSM 15176]